MADPIRINPSFKPPPGGGEESLAASSSMIVTVLEKELKLKKSDNVVEDKKIKLEELDKYIKELSKTSTVEPVKKREERREEEKEEARPEERRGEGKGKRGKGRQTRAFDWMKKKIVFPPRTIVLKAGEKDVYKEKLSADTLKEYVTLHLKTAIGIPKDELEKNKAALASLENKLKELKQVDFVGRTRAELGGIIAREMSYMIKSSLTKKLSHDEGATEWLITSRRSGNILGFALYNEAIGEIDKYTPKELAALAEELDIDLASWLSKFFSEKISFGEDGSVIVDTKLLEDEWQRALLLDEYKLHEINFIMGEGFINKLLIKGRLKKVVGALLELNTPESEIRGAASDAKRIAWAKIVTELKDLHLARVFTSSEGEFDKYSKKISGLTKKARRLGAGVSEKGLKLVTGKLDLLALETANYKLELLKSLQGMEFDKEREREIGWLTLTTGRLKEVEERVEFWERVRNLILKLFP